MNKEFCLQYQIARKAMNEELETEKKLAILEQEIDDGNIDYMDTIRNLVKENEKLTKALKED